MTRRAIRVFWGRRPESVQAVASRWRRTLEQVEFLLPEVVGGSWQQIHSAGPATAVTVDQLAQVLENAAGRRRLVGSSGNRIEARHPVEGPNGGSNSPGWRAANLKSSFSR